MTISSGDPNRSTNLFGKVLPAYAAAAAAGCIELSTTPFYHPILPLICDTNKEQCQQTGLAAARRNGLAIRKTRVSKCSRGLALHEQVFGVRPRGMWPSEGSVSNEVLAMAHELGVKWLATDEGVLGRSLGTFFSATAPDS